MLTINENFDKAETKIEVEYHKRQYRNKGPVTHTIMHVQRTKNE